MINQELGDQTVFKKMWDVSLTNTISIICVWYLEPTSVWMLRCDLKM